jgi:hypothetical protein
MSENWAIFIVGATWTLLMAIMGALVTRVLMAIDRNMKDLGVSLKDLATKHEKLSLDFYEMRGEHYSNHGRRASDK